ncbi:Pappalysin-2 [Labeo rohita]|uniref:Pappalysin-2 n=1 Tax=Labeo rohita TaxID=84645 RepID=A0ABQ8MZ25_LABRO|nr:Pappalysin-2 [Labeo rohita]
MWNQVEAGLFERTPHAQESQKYLWQTALVFLLLASDPPFGGDGWCDTINNRAYCQYDGGDCCPSTLSSKKCQSPSHVVPPHCQPFPRTSPTSLGAQVACSPIERMSSGGNRPLSWEFGFILQPVVMARILDENLLLLILNMCSPPLLICSHKGDRPVLINPSNPSSVIQFGVDCDHDECTCRDPEAEENKGTAKRKEPGAP